MGGSSLAPEVVCGAAGVGIVVVDSSDPDFVRDALEERLEHTVVVVSSKSGGTVETDSQRRAFEQAFHEAGIDPTERIVVVTDPGSPLDEEASAAGYRVFRADPGVGGRYSALTAFGLVPSGLAGADIGALLDEAAAARPALEADEAENPGLRLGALLGTAHRAGADKLSLADAGSPFDGLGDWIEQLVAESTGKEGTGVLPVVVENTSVPDFSPSRPDEVLATWGPGRVDAEPASGFAVAVDAPLGAQMLLWEYATAVVGRLIAINPFDQPDVESAKAAARDLLDGGGSAPSPAFADGDVVAFASDGWLPAGTESVVDAVAALLDRIDGDRGYLAVQAYRHRLRDASLVVTRPALAERTGRPVTFGWGPRFLHSTGPVPQGRPGHRGLPADHRRARRGPRGARPTVHVPDVPRRAGRRRRPRAGGEGVPGPAAARADPGGPGGHPGGPRRDGFRGRRPGLSGPAGARGGGGAGPAGPPGRGAGARRGARARPDRRRRGRRRPPGGGPAGRGRRRRRRRLGPRRRLLGRRAVRGAGRPRPQRGAGPRGAARPRGRRPGAGAPDALHGRRAGRGPGGRAVRATGCGRTAPGASRC